MKKSIFFLLCTVILFLTQFVTNYNFGILNNAVSLFDTYFNSSYFHQFHTTLDDVELQAIYSTVTTSFLVGNVIGCFVSGYACDRFGRMRAVHIGNGFSVLGSMLVISAKYSNWFELMYVGRITQGIGCSIVSLAIRLYIGEISPTRYRGLTAGMQLPLAMIAESCALILASNRILGTRNLWPVLAGLSIPFSIVLSIVVSIVPDSPQQLLLHKPERASQARKYYTINNSGEDEPLVSNAQSHRSLHTDRIGLREIIQRYKKVMFVAMCTSLTVELGLRGIYKAYAATILEACSLSPDQSTFAVTMIGYAEIPTGFVWMMFMHKYPRKKLFISLCIVMESTGILLAIVSPFSHHPQAYWAQIICVIMVAVGVVVAPFAGSMCGTIGVELCDQISRSKILSLTVTTGRLAEVVSITLFPIVMKQAGVSIAIIPLAILGLGFLIAIAVLLPETGNCELGAAYAGQQPLHPELEEMIALAR